MKYLITFLFILINANLFAQNGIDDLLKLHNDNSVPYISVHELAMPRTEALIIDTRELEEYNVSHIKNAVFVGYNNFKLEDISKELLFKDQKIVVYCSLGIRSENIASQLKEAGYTEVYNLYGGIFEWKNQGFDVFDKTEKQTENVHVFSAGWGKWLLNGNKVY